MSAIAEAFVKLRPDTSTFKQEAALGVQGGISGLGAGKGLTAIGVGGLRAAAGVTAVTAAATVGAVALREIVTGAAAFETEMNVLRVTSQATDAEMEKLSDTAKDLGADVKLPATSATDAAVALNELAKAGLSVEDSMAGARGVLQLAAAGELEVRDAAMLASTTLNAFGLSGDQATHVADLLAGASIAAQGEVSDMGASLQQAAAVAHQTGLSVEQTAGAIALLAKNGIIGSDAGTSLRTTLLRLIPTTKEAKQFTDALGISIDENRTLGEQLPEVIEQYHDSLSRLSPALQQVALTQIFGTDAIRAASIFAREGAEGFNEMTAAVDRQGAAEELATARTQGLAGTFEGLKSQLSSLAVEIGELTNPVLTDLLKFMSDGVGIVLDFTRGIKDLGSAVANVEVPFSDSTIGEGIREGVSNTFDRIPGVGLVKQAIEIKQRFDEARQSVGDLRQEVIDAGDFKGSPDVIDRNQAVADARLAGREVGNQFGQSTADGITASSDLAVASARAMAARVAEQGKAAIAAAIAGAQQNLTSLGSQLASAAGEIIDSGVDTGLQSAGAGARRGISAFQRNRLNKAVRDAQEELNRALKNVPIEREIERIQRQLDQANQRDDARDVRRGLRDAQEELANARRQAQTAGPLDARQQAAQRRFLRPFVEGVQDARSEVRKFTLEGRLDKLQKRLDDQTDDIAENIERLREALASARNAIVESQQSFATGGLTNSLKSAAQAQKEAVTRGIDDAIQQFNDGLITLPQLNKRLAKLLADNDIDYKNAGEKLGYAFRRRFEEILRGINVQGADILGGPQDPGAGVRATRVIPAAVARTVALNNEEAQRRLQEALVEQGETANGYLKRIADAQTGPRGGRPSTSIGDSAADKANTAAATQVGPSPKPPPRTRAKPRTRLHDPPEN